MFRKVYILFLSLILIFGFSFLPKTIIAQTTFDSIELTITPENPEPNTTVVASLNVYGMDINTIYTTWFLNDKVVLAGNGERLFSFNTGSVGTKNTLEVVGKMANGKTFSKKIALSPAKVDILYEAESYTPPFYKGKAKFPFQGSLRIVALPSFIDSNGKKVSNSRLIFKWKNGNQILNNQSGYGKNILLYKSDESLPKQTEITAEVSFPEESLIAVKKILIEPTSPETVFYEENPEYGILFNKALSETFTIEKEEATISAIPLFFGVTDKDSSLLNYKWILADKSIEQGGSSIVLGNKSGKTGQTQLSVQISNTKDYFQAADNSLNIIFKKINNLIK